MVTTGGRVTRSSSASSKSVLLQVILGGLGQIQLQRHAEVAADQTGGIVVQFAVDVGHHAQHQQLLEDLTGGLADTLGQVLDGDGLGGHVGLFDLDGSHQLLGAGFLDPGPAAAAHHVVVVAVELIPGQLLAVFGHALRVMLTDIVLLVGVIIADPLLLHHGSQINRGLGASSAHGRTVAASRTAEAACGALRSALRIGRTAVGTLRIGRTAIRALRVRRAAIRTLRIGRTAIRALRVRRGGHTDPADWQDGHTSLADSPGGHRDPADWQVGHTGPADSRDGHRGRRDGGRCPQDARPAGERDEPAAARAAEPAGMRAGLCAAWWAAAGCAGALCCWGAVCDAGRLCRGRHGLSGLFGFGRVLLRRLGGCGGSGLLFFLNLLFLFQLLHGLFLLLLLHGCGSRLLLFLPLP